MAWMRMRSLDTESVTLRSISCLGAVCRLLHLFMPDLYGACGRLGAPDPARAHLGLQVDAKVVLGDRLVSVTLARAWASLTQWQRMRLLWDLMRLGGSSSSQDQLTDKLESYRGVRALLSLA